MLSKLLAFIRSRPTEVWLGTWTSVVAVLTAFGITFNPAVVSAVGTVLAWITTFIATRTEGLGPQQ